MLGVVLMVCCSEPMVRGKERKGKEKQKQCVVWSLRTHEKGNSAFLSFDAVESTYVGGFIFAALLNAYLTQLLF